MATAYYTPGVYIEEVDKGPKPIQGVGTSVTAFVGFTKRAIAVNEDGHTTRSILSQPTLVTNWTQFENSFGGLDENAYLPYAVQGFFNNGGITAWVISIRAFETHVAQALVMNEKGKAPSLMIHAKTGGAAGDKIKVLLREASSGDANSGDAKPKSDASSSIASERRRRPNDPSVTTEPPTAEGGQAASGESSTTASGSGGSSSSGSSSSGSSSSSGGSSSGGSSGGGATASATPSPTPADPSAFTVIVQAEGKADRSYQVRLDDLPVWSERNEQENHAFDDIKVWRMSKSGKLDDRKPKLATYALEGGAPTYDLDSLASDQQTLLLSDGVKTEDQEKEFFNRNGLSLFAGSAPRRRGIGALEAIDNFNILCAPDLAMAHQKGWIDDENFRGIQQQMLDFCKSTHYRFAILDAPYNKRTPAEILDWRMNMAGYDSMHGALYYPWIKIPDPVSGRSRFVPPSGYIAGIYSRSDSERGVHKAPANEVVAGTIDVQINVTRGEQDLLNPVGINCIRKFAGRGIRVWGARTLSSDPAWRYINVRRLFNYVEESIERSTQWAVFEPNDVYLWGKMRRDITAFLRTVWRSGALFGVDPNTAFYVKCDEELNPSEIRDQGMMICEVGLAPVKPAEFVVFRFSQYALPSA